MVISYVNGSFIGTSDVSSIHTEQVVNSVIVAESIGMPFNGTPTEMAEDVLSNLRCNLIPVVLKSWSHSDYQGDYTSKVIFQAAQGSW